MWHNSRPASAAGPANGRPNLDPPFGRAAFPQKDSLADATANSPFPQLECHYSNIIVPAHLHFRPVDVPSSQKWHQIIERTLVDENDMNRAGRPGEDNNRPCWMRAAMLRERFDQYTSKLSDDDLLQVPPVSFVPGGRMYSGGGSSQPFGLGGLIFQLDPPVETNVANDWLSEWEARRLLKRDEVADAPRTVFAPEYWEHLKKNSSEARLDRGGKRQF